MKIFNCLDKNEKIFGAKFIEASAGTGKTFTIEHLYVRLLCEREPFLSVERLLVVTFTNAATVDLKKRIRKNIENTIFLLKEEKIEIDYIQKFFPRKDQLIHHLEESLSLFDQAEICTIHSFCQKMLSENIFETEFFYLEKNEAKMKEELFSFLSFYDLKMDLYRKNLISLFQKNPENFFQKVLLLINRPSPENFFDLFQKEIIHFQKEIQTNKILQDFENLQDCFKKRKAAYKEEMLKNECCLFLDFLTKRSLCIEDFDRFLKTDWNLFSFFSFQNLRKNAVLPKLHFSEFFECLNVFQKIYEKAKDLNFQLLFFSKRFKEYLKKKYEGIRSFDEILERMLVSIKRKEFKKKVQKRFSAVIVDEFQDTDPLQWEILSTLFLNNENIINFTVVGDPKQSIYGFRQADLYTYFQASQKLCSQKKLYLDTNYRSDPRLVDALNEIFSKNRLFFLPKENKYIDFYPVKSGKKICENKQCPVHFFISELEANGKKRWPRKDILKKKIFPYLSKEIKELQKSFSFSEIAVLVSNRFEAAELKKFLESRNFPVQVNSMKKLSESAVFQALKELFSAVISLRDLSKIKKVMMGPFFRWDLQEVLCIDEKKEDLFFYFHALYEVLQNYPLYKFFDLFLKNEHAVTHCFLDDEEFKKEFFYIIDLFLKHKIQKEVLFLFFEDPLQFIEEDSISLSESDDAIQILTIHKSKGLEFSVVFALGLATRYANSFESFEALLKNDSVEHLKKESDEEKLRQLYVALTRAKNKVYIPLVLEKKNARVQFKNAPLEILFSRWHENSELHFDEFYQSLKSLNNSSFEILPDAIEDQYLEINKKNFFEKEKKKFHFSPSSSILSFTSLSQKNERFDEAVFTEKSFNEILPRGAKTGVILHGIFEKYFKSFRDINRLIEKELKHTGYEQYKETISEMIHNGLSSLLHPFDFSLNDVNQNQIIAEMEFLYPDEKDYIKGYIDLLFYHEGKYYLLDWKTNYLGKEPECYHPSNLQKEIYKHQYDLQASVYAEFLKRKLSESFEEKFGGIFYVFVRGLQYKNHGIYHFFPEPYLIKKEML